MLIRQGLSGAVSPRC